MATSTSSGPVRFGVFEIDLDSGELRKQGIKIKLHDQPFRILVMLVERPGQVITREELCRALWPADTFVDSDLGLNSAVMKLRAALGDSAENPRFVETLPRRGYRFIAPIEFVKAPNNGTVSTSAHQPLPSRLSIPAELLPELKVRNGIKWLPRFAIVSLLILAIVALAFLGWRVSKPKTTSPMVHAIALLPLDNLSGDPSQEYLTTGVTDELITELAQATGVPVVSRTSSMLYKNKQKSMKQIAHELGVDMVVEGTLKKEEGHLRMTLHLIDGTSDKSLWAKEYEGEMSHVRELEIRAAGDLADRLRTSGQKRVELDNPRPVAAEAYEEYLKGQTALMSATQKSDAEAALRHFERAAAIQPDYAAAYGAIAKTLVVFEFNGEIRPFDAFPRITAAAEKALSIDPQTTDAHMALANTILVRDWNWPASEAETLRAIASHPNDSYVYRWYAIKLEWHGDLAKALEQERLAVKLDPVSQNSIRYYAQLLEKTGNLKEALEQYQLAHEMNPNIGQPAFARALNRSGQPDRAATEFVQFCLSQHQLEIAAEFKRQYPAVGYTKAEAAAMRSMILRGLERMQQKSANNEYTSPTAFVRIYAQLKNREETLRYLEQAYREHSPVVLELRSEGFDFIRDDPRFDKIFRSIPFYR